MTRYTFDPRVEFTLNERRRYCRTFSVGVRDTERPSWDQLVARITGPSEHAHAIRAAAHAYCDRLNVPASGEARVVVLDGQGPHAEARVVVNGRVVAQCGTFDNGLNEAWAGLIASCLNSVLHALPVGQEP